MRRNNFLPPLPKSCSFFDVSLFWARTSTTSQTHHYEAFMCKKAAAEDVFSCWSVALNEGNDLKPLRSSFLKQPNLISQKTIIPFSLLRHLSTLIFRNVFNFCPFISASAADSLLFDPSPLVSSASSFTAWSRSWHPGHHEKPWRTAGNKPENGSNLQESSPFTRAAVVLCALIQPRR